jgi:hypothetical protein
MRSYAAALLLVSAAPLHAAPEAVLSPEDRAAIMAMANQAERFALSSPSREQIDALLDQAFAEAVGAAWSCRPVKAGADRTTRLAQLESCAAKSGAGEAGFAARFNKAFLARLDGESAVLAETDFAAMPADGEPGDASIKAQIQGSTLLISMPGLSQQTEAQLGTELSRAPSGHQRIILDLRGNQGGLLDQITRIAALFVPPGPGFIVQGPHDVREAQLVPLASSAHDYKTPLIVLVDSTTASGAEMLASILQERGRATIAGTRTEGHGTIHTLLNLRRDRYLKLVTGQMLRASGNPIQTTGINPDVSFTDVAPAQWVEAAAKEEPLPVRATNR